MAVGISVVKNCFEKANSFQKEITFNGLTSAFHLYTDHELLSSADQIKWKKIFEL